MADREPQRPSERELIKRYFAPLCAPDKAFGLSDDTAFLDIPENKSLVITKDMLVADIHFFATDAPDKIASKALRVNLSDLAAKGADPFGYLLGLGLPKDWEEQWLASFCEGLRGDQALYSFPLLGGDTVKSPERLTLSITALGLVPRGTQLLRQNAEPGQFLYTTGSIGDSALGLGVAHGKPLSGLSAEERSFLHDRFLLPQPRLALSDLLCEYAQASMDISDGLIGDADKMAHAAGVCVAIDQRQVPLSGPANRLVQRDPSCWQTILTGGDDYELLFTVRAEDQQAFEQEIKKQDLRVSCIGQIRSGAGVTLIGADGSKQVWQSEGSYEHF